MRAMEERLNTIKIVHRQGTVGFDDVNDDERIDHKLHTKIFSSYDCQLIIKDNFLWYY